MPTLPPGKYGRGGIESEAIYLYSFSIYRAPGGSQLTFHKLGVEVVGDFTPNLQRGNWDSDSPGSLPGITHQADGEMKVEVGTLLVHSFPPGSLMFGDTGELF